MAFPTFQELYNAARAELQARNPSLTDFREGSVNDAVVGSGAVLADEVIAVLIDLFAAQFIDTAEGAELDTLALDRFGLTRNAETAAIGAIRWTRDAAGAYTIPAATRIQATIDGSSTIVTTDANVLLLASESFTDIPATATELGPDSNIAAGTATEILDVVGADASATANNPERFAGGSDAEEDDTFRDRIRRFFATVVRGTVAALIEGALTVAGVVFAAVDEAFIEPDDGGYVAVYVGDPDGASNSAQAALVETELENWRCAGIKVEVTGSEREEIPLVVTLTIPTGADQTAIRAAARVAMLAYTDSLLPNETMRLSKLDQAIHASVEDVIAVNFTSPTADLAPTSAYKAIRVLTTAITINLVEV